ncbi:MAG: Mitochondrial distribution and morphology protein 31, mitochondrial precursor [Phylliscum demangeonii]|nr:MAG: Mitochondrial distribution and morphology protein 31, mitochondrial precursor [Phylliscum demangeonii]
MSSEFNDGNVVKGLGGRPSTSPQNWVLREKPGTMALHLSKEVQNQRGKRKTRYRKPQRKLPALSLHRPTREELLAAATGFWSRQKIRFKWFSIRSLRPFNTDDISAFFSWFLVGHVIWILVGTTTFFSLAIITVNTVFAQGK